MRGSYDLSGIRSDADVMLWLHGSAVEDLQWALRELRRTELLRPLIRVWNTIGTFPEPAARGTQEPVFVRGDEPQQWLAIHPFTLSPEWHQLDTAARNQLVENFNATKALFPQAKISMIATFGLSEHEWLLRVEADVPTELVDAVRAMRAVDPQPRLDGTNHFFTGRRIEVAEIVEVLP